MRRYATITIALALSGCFTRYAPPASQEESSAGGEHPAASSDSTASADPTDEDVPLAERLSFPGTGISIRPPLGSERSLMGSALVHQRRQIQIVSAAAEGDLSVHQQFRTSLVADADALENESLELGDLHGDLMIDRMEQGGLELERVWLVARKGTRSAMVMAVYPAERSDRQRALARASVLSLEVDPEQPIDPELAVGWRPEPVAGMELVRATSSNISYSVDGNAPREGEPFLFLTPIPARVAEADREAACPELLSRLVTYSEDTPVETIAGEGMVGCEITSTTERNIVGYAALVFKDDGVFMVGGSAPVSEQDNWLDRFRGVSRTLHPIE